MFVTNGTLPWNNLGLYIEYKGHVDGSPSNSAGPFITSQLNDWLSGLKIFKVFVSCSNKTVFQIKP
jgi:hypothetical protein